MAAGLFSFQSFKKQANAILADMLSQDLLYQCGGGSEL
jgi:hypothetical protein